MISIKMTFVPAMTGVVIGGCSPQASQQTYLPAPATAPHSLSASPVLEAAINDVGRYGEEIYDLVKGGDWRKAKSDLVSLKQAASQLPAEVNGNGSEQVQLNDTIQALDHGDSRKELGTRHS